MAETIDITDRQAKAMADYINARSLGNIFTSNDFYLWPYFGGPIPTPVSKNDTDLVLECLVASGYVKELSEDKYRRNSSARMTKEDIWNAIENVIRASKIRKITKESDE